jgi:hypothetical protein
MLTGKEIILKKTGKSSDLYLLYSSSKSCSLYFRKPAPFHIEQNVFNVKTRRGPIKSVSE